MNFTDRPNPSSPLIKKVAAGNLEELYMGLQEGAIFSMYPYMNFDEFVAFAAGLYEMKKSRPVRIEELAVIPSIAQYVGTAHQQVMPNGKFVLDSVRDAEGKIYSSARKGFDPHYARKLDSLNIYGPKDLEKRLALFDEKREVTAAFLFEQFKKQPKLPFIQIDMEPEALEIALANPDKYHKVPYQGDITRDKFRAYQTLDDVYALEIARMFASVNK